MSEKPPLRQKLTKKNTHQLWRRFFIGLAIIFAGAVAVIGGQLGGAFLSEFLLAPFDSLQGIQMTFVRYLIVQTIVVALLIGVGYSFKASLSEFGLGKIKNWTYLLLLPLIYIATLILGAIASLLVAFLSPDYNASQAQQLGLPPVGEGDLLVTGLFLAVVVPLVEEFIFRGYLFGMLRRYAPFWLVTVIVSALFAAAHGQINVAINVFILSLALCYMREKTGSIWTGVALHALKNFVAFLLLFVFNVV